MCSVCHLELENICILRVLIHIANLPTKVYAQVTFPLTVL